LATCCGRIIGCVFIRTSNNISVISVVGVSFIVEETGAQDLPQVTDKHYTRLYRVYLTMSGNQTYNFVIDTDCTGRYVYCLA